MSQFIRCENALIFLLVLKSENFFLGLRTTALLLYEARKIALSYILLILYGRPAYSELNSRGLCTVTNVLPLVGTFVSRNSICVKQSAPEYRIKSIGKPFT